MRFILLILVVPFSAVFLNAQTPFAYSVEFEAVNLPELPGIHSYAFGQYNGIWVIIGGRLDGLHARQPFNAFPASSNNQQIFLVDPELRRVWNASLDGLPEKIKAQLQSTNMNFYQDHDTLYIIGGYAFSAMANDHITFPFLTTVHVSALIESIINGEEIEQHFQQIQHDHFAITGGQLGKLGDHFILVGGHRFDGRYNPMNNPTFVQEYSNQIRKFKVHNEDGNLSFSDYSTINDPIHLRRRDFNLLPQVFSDGKLGYMISSGVFQIDEDLPFLYPVDIKDDTIFPNMEFNQYLSNYHSAKATLYDPEKKEMHNLFFGGMGQYFYENGILVEDQLVPFIKTVSMVSRHADGSLSEFNMPVELPGLKGAGAELILNEQLSYSAKDVIDMSTFIGDTIILGHIFGGIHSPTLNPFSVNRTNTTIADPSIYKVKLVKSLGVSLLELDGSNPYEVTVFPNPVSSEVHVVFDLETKCGLVYYIHSSAGKLLQKGRIYILETGNNHQVIPLNSEARNQQVVITFVFDDRFYVSKQLIVRN